MEEEIPHKQHSREGTPCVIRILKVSVLFNSDHSFDENNVAKGWIITEKALLCLNVTYSLYYKGICLVDLTGVGDGQYVCVRVWVSVYVRVRARLSVCKCCYLPSHNLARWIASILLYEEG